MRRVVNFYFIFLASKSKDGHALRYALRVHHAHAACARHQQILIGCAISAIDPTIILMKRSKANPAGAKR